MFGQKEYHVRRLGSAHTLVKDFGDFSFALMRSLIASIVLHLMAKAIPITKNAANSAVASDLVLEVGEDTTTRATRVQTSDSADCKTA